MNIFQSGWQCQTECENVRLSLWTVCCLTAAYPLGMLAQQNTHWVCRCLSCGLPQHLAMLTGLFLSLLSNGCIPNGYAVT